MAAHARSVGDLDLSSASAGRSYHPSPKDWGDHVFYFLMVDRFSDGNESGRRPYDPSRDFEGAERDGSRADWEDSAGRWNGGTLRGLLSRLDYLQRLGITAIWISPILKQTTFGDNYHGYATQDFLCVDPRFGTSEDLQAVTAEAHRRGLLVVLDIVVNHAGDVFAYEQEAPAWTGETFAVKAFRDPWATPTIPFGAGIDRETAWPDGAVWPKELQDPEAFERKGEIRNWDHDPEYEQGDFFSLKAFHLGGGDGESFHPSPALLALTQVYKFWIAHADIDGFRIDTVKHLGRGPTRFFAREIREFARSLGKLNFALIGEIAGSMEFAVETFRATGLTAALGINRIPAALANTAKGHEAPLEYFGRFSNTPLLGEDAYAWFRDNVVTMFDDHDMASLGAERKHRFCAERETAMLLPNALFLNVMSLGIPCIYYGTEQAFDGTGDGDRYVRECMFGGPFGAFRTRGVHFFDTGAPVYRELARMLDLRRRLPVLRQGRQYLRPVSSDGVAFEAPAKVDGGRVLSLVAWSRILGDEECVLVFNTDADNSRCALVLIDATLNGTSERFRCLYCGDPGREGHETPVQAAGPKGELKAIRVELPPAGRALYCKAVG